VEEEPEELDDEELQETSASEINLHIVWISCLRLASLPLFCFHAVWSKFRNQDIVVSRLALV
jgi:hypothetical protein